MTGERHAVVHHDPRPAEERRVRLRRRLVSIPTMLGATVLAIGMLPIGLPLVIAVDAVRGRLGFPTLRSYLFVIQYLINDSVEIIAALALWVAAGFGRRLNSPASIRRHQQLQAWSLCLLAERAEQLLGLRIELRDDPATVLRPGPVIVLSRHVSIVDASLPALITDRAGLAVRGVVMAEMLADPGFDLIYGRTGSVFISRDDGPTARELVEQMTSAADDRTAYAIFPEGRLNTSSARRRSLDRLAQTSPGRAERLQSLRHLLPPRPGGVLALLDALPLADVVLLDHRGLESYPRMGRLMAAAPVEAAVAVHLRRFPRSEIPEDSDDRIAWLDDLWLGLDHDLDQDGPAVGP